MKLRLTDEQERIIKETLGGGEIEQYRIADPRQRESFIQTREYKMPSANSDKAHEPVGEPEVCVFQTYHHEATGFVFMAAKSEKLNRIFLRSAATIKLSFPYV